MFYYFSQRPNSVDDILAQAEKDLRDDKSLIAIGKQFLSKTLRNSDELPVQLTEDFLIAQENFENLDEESIVQELNQNPSFKRRPR